MTGRGALVWLGRAVSLAALAWLAFAVRDQRATLSAWRPSRGDGVLVAGAALVYGLALFLVAEAWHRLVSHAAAGVALRRNLTIPSMGITQLAKYLPGNVFHLVGRHAWLARAGAPHSALALALAWEAACLALAAVMTASVLALVWPVPADLPFLSVREAALTALAAVAAFGVLTIVLRARFESVRRRTPSPAVAAGALAVLAGFFLIQALVFVALTAAADATPTAAALPIPVGAWLVGFLTPGAPGGLGTRELALSTWMVPIVGPAKSLLAAALFRLVTLLGDAVAFVVSWALLRRSGS
jgi:uncharacterized membrane protein YbhN (UPF0104 family)